MGLTKPTTPISSSPTLKVEYSTILFLKSFSTSVHSVGLAGVAQLLTIVVRLDLVRYELVWFKPAPKSFKPRPYTGNIKSKSICNLDVHVICWLLSGNYHKIGLIMIIHSIRITVPPQDAKPPVCSTNEIPRWNNNNRSRIGCIFLLHNSTYNLRDSAGLFTTSWLVWNLRRVRPFLEKFETFWKLGIQPVHRKALALQIKKYFLTSIRSRLHKQCLFLELNALLFYQSYHESFQLWVDVIDL